MKWFSEWWGITITAETKMDTDLLVELSNRLPKKLDAWDCHEAGTLDVEEDKGILYLVFCR